MSNLQRRVMINSAICGTIVAVFVLIIDAAGLLRPLEAWLYDKRAATCQYFTPPPAQPVVYLDVDNDALDTIHRWPWPRHIMASILDEVRLAKPKAVGIDVLYSEPQPDLNVKQPDGTYQTVSEDPALIDAIGKLKCVVLPESFKFGTASDVVSKLDQAGVAEMSKDLTMGQPELASRLIAQGFTGAAVAARIEMDFVDIREQAVRAAVRQRLLANPNITLEQIQRELIANAAYPTTLPSGRVVPPVTDEIRQEYPHVQAELKLRRFSIPEPAHLRAPPPDATMTETPLPQLCDRIVGAGYADYRIFSDASVRAVPLFVRINGRLYPQFAFAVACKILDVDLSSVRVTDDAVILPGADGGDVKIPVRAQYSPSLQRDVGAIMDIPWFGNSEWVTMYDWPQHKRIIRHHSMNVVWNIIEDRNRIATNNKAIDQAVLILLDVLDKAARQKYADQKLDPEDFDSRKTVATKILKNLSDLGFEIDKPPSTMQGFSSDEQFVYRTIPNLQAALQQNNRLEGELERHRRDLAGIVGGKGVLIGAVATATGDFVPTSLHPSCPGVVVHGVIINAILNRDFLRTAPRLYTILLTLMFGLLTTALTSRMPPARAVPFLLLLAGGYFVANGLLFYDRLNIIVSAAAPMVAIGACWSACMIVRLVLEGLERIRLAREAAVINHEITLARQVQQALIPKELTILTNIQSHGWTMVATTTGGDCFDLWKLADGRLGILVADASGHGLGPSILVTEVRALVRGLCDLYEQPQKLLERVNQRLASDLDGSKFVTAFVAFVTEDGKLEWGSAGHGPMLWAPTADASPHELEATGLPLGVSSDWFGEESVPQLQLEPGGWLMVVSDGIFEAPNPAGEQFEISRVKQTIAEMADSHPSCEQVVSRLRDVVHRWQVKDDPADDQTIVMIRHSPAEAKTDAAGAGVTAPEPASDEVTASLTPATSSEVS